MSLAGEVHSVPHVEEPQDVREEPADQALPSALVGEAFTPPWAGWLMRHRAKFFLGLGLLWLACFNGLWRIGIDSSLYRLVARSLAAGEGYTVFGAREDHVYPGLPLLLAGLEKLFGPVAWPGVIVAGLCAAGVLVVTYRVMRYHAAPWLATVITLGVGLNGIFVQHGHELMTDMPFLLGVVLTLWGWEILLSNQAPARTRVRGAVTLVVGLAIAAAMRPTFWVVAVSIGVVCVGGAMLALGRLASGERAGRGGWMYLAGLGLMAIVAVGFFLLDPRADGVNPTAGVYEQEALQELQKIGQNAATRLNEVFRAHLPLAFFGGRMKPVPLFWVGLLLIGVVATGWKHRPLWALMVFVLLGVVLIISSVERYYMMVLPIFWFSWMLVVLWFAHHIPRWSTAMAARFGSKSLIPETNFARGVIVLVGLFIPVFQNLFEITDFLIEQRHPDFLAYYKEGRYIPVKQTAELIRKHVPEGELVIGPYPRILAYESGRPVKGQRELLHGIEGPSARLEALRDSGAKYMVFPHQAYDRKDEAIEQLIRRGVIVPLDTIAENPGELGKRWYLAHWTIDEAAAAENDPDEAASMETPTRGRDRDD